MICKLEDLDGMRRAAFRPDSRFDNIDNSKADSDGSDLHEDDAELNNSLQGM